MFEPIRCVILQFNINFITGHVLHYNIISTFLLQSRRARLKDGPAQQLPGMTTYEGW